MNRENASARLVDYLYGEMAPEEREAFERLLESDPALRAEADAMGQVRKAAAGLPRMELPADARRRILRAAHRHARA